MSPNPLIAPIARALLRSQSDARLVTLAREGHDDAFAEIDRRYRAPLVAFAAAFAPGAGEDIVQESLTRAWSAIRDTEAELHLKPWLYTIVRNQSLNSLRGARPSEPLDDTVDGVRQPSEIVLQRDELNRVVAAVAALPDGQREALIASAIDGRTHDQIAAELGTSPGSVRGLIHRGRTSVRTAAGSIIPLPVVSAALDSAGGLAVGGAATGLAGASMLGKAAAVAAVGVLATGSGIVIERSLDGKPARESQARADSPETPLAGSQARGDENPKRPSREKGTSSEDGSPDENPGNDDDDRNEGPSSNSGRGSGDDREDDDDSSGPGPGGDDDPDTPETPDTVNPPGGDNSGPGGGSNSGSGSSGSGSGSSGSGSGSSGSSGSGSSGSGSSGSGSSGSGSGGDDSHD